MTSFQRRAAPHAGSGAIMFGIILLGTSEALFLIQLLGCHTVLQNCGEG